MAESPGMARAFAKALVPGGKSGYARVPAFTAELPDQRQDLARLAAYNRVCGFTLRDAVPATWLHVLTFPLHMHLLSHRDSTVKLVGAVHVQNSMTLHRPVLATERLTLSVKIENVRAHRRGALLDMVGAACVGDDVVWEGVSTYLAQGAKAEGDLEEVARPEHTPATPQAKWTLAADLGRQYRTVSGDPNPIHTSRVAARAFGFKRPIIHGMWSHARALAALEGRLPDAYTARVNFQRPIALPGTVGFSASRTSEGFDTVVTNRDGSKPHLFMTVSGAQ